MDLLLVIVLLLVFLAVFGGLFASKLLWLVLLVAFVVWLLSRRAPR